MAEAVLSREPPPPPQAPYVEPPKSAYPNIHPLALAASTPTAQILPAPVGGLHSTLPLHGTAQFLLPPDGAFAQPLHSTLNFAPPSGYGQTQVFGPTPGARPIMALSDSAKARCRSRGESVESTASATLAPTLCTVCSRRNHSRSSAAAKP